MEGLLMGEGTSAAWVYGRGQKTGRSDKRRRNRLVELPPQVEAALFIILVAHAHAWAAGTGLEVRSELRACAEVVLNGLGRIPEDADRSMVAKDMAGLLCRIAAHANVGEEGRSYAETAGLLVEWFPRVSGARSANEALVALEQDLVVGGRPESIRRRGARSPSLLSQVKSGGLRPSEVPKWLDKQARRWRLAGIEEPSFGLVIKTPEIAKGDTCDVVVVYHAENLPRPERRSFLAKARQDQFARPAQAYVPVSRPRFVYVGLAVGRLPAYHEEPLEGWTYLDARKGVPSLARLA